MHSTLRRAGRATHLKIVLVSLAAALVVVVIGLNARTGSFDAASTASGPSVVKAPKTPTYAGNEDAQVR
jgi:hypothetical protein